MRRTAYEIAGEAWFNFLDRRDKRLSVRIDAASRKLSDYCDKRFDRQLDRTIAELEALKRYADAYVPMRRPAHESLIEAITAAKLVRVIRRDDPVWQPIRATQKIIDNDIPF